MTNNQRHPPFAISYNAELTSTSCGKSVHCCLTCHTALFNPHSLAQQTPPLPIKDYFNQSDILTIVRRLKNFLNTSSNTVDPQQKKTLLKLCRAAEYKIKKRQKSNDKSR